MHGDVRRSGVKNNIEGDGRRANGEGAIVAGVCVLVHDSVGGGQMAEKTPCEGTHKFVPVLRFLESRPAYFLERCSRCARAHWPISSKDLAFMLRRLSDMCAPVACASSCGMTKAWAESRKRSETGSGESITAGRD